MKIVFLIINYMPHQIASIQAVIDLSGAAVTVFVYQENEIDPRTNWTSIPFKNISKVDLLSKILEIEPDLLVVAGWAIKDYVWVSKQVRSQTKIPTVAYSDTQWRNTIRQKINCVISPLHLRKAFSHLWVSGVYQYEYARKLGYAKHQIIFGSVSCDIKRFDNELRSEIAYPKIMLFVGRFIPSKGIDMLLSAWDSIANKNGWRLVLVGSGDLGPMNRTDVEVKNHMTQHELKLEMRAAGCFVFPSKWDQWAVVLHEAAASGLPIIATNVCGATPHFVISGYNGYQIDPEVSSLLAAMEIIINKSDLDLATFGERSRKLSKSITPEIGAANLLSILTKTV